MFAFILLLIFIIMLILIHIYKKMDSAPLPDTSNEKTKNNEESKKQTEIQKLIQNKVQQPYQNQYIYDKQPKKDNYKNYYKPKRYLITKNELVFYNVLLNISKELDLLLLSQVSLYNILEPKNNLDYRTRGIYFNKIASKSIDFVLVDKSNCRIKLCIELDDSTHNQQKRIQRDNFLNQLFSDLEIDFIRFKVSNYYDKDALKNRISESIKEHYYID